MNAQKLDKVEQGQILQVSSQEQDHDELKVLSEKLEKIQSNKVDFFQTVQRKNNERVLLAQQSKEIANVEQRIS